MLACKLIRRTKRTWNLVEFLLEMRIDNVGDEQKFENCRIMFL